jgi:hypothetical protein
MMREFIYWVHTSLPGIPPYAVIVTAFLLVSLGLYVWTRSKGYLITFLSGLGYFFPWVWHMVTH